MASRVFLGELLLKIFEDLPKETVFQAMLVCRSWNSVATCVYYKDISLQENPLRFLHTFYPSENMQLTRNLGVYVKSVKFGSLRKFSNNGEQQYNTTTTFLDYFKNVMLLLPNVRTIYLGAMKEPLLYSFFVDLLKLPENSLPPIEKIEMKRYLDYQRLSEETIQAYTKSVYRLRKTITHLSLNQINQMTFDREDGCQNLRLFNCLSHFSNLEHLTIKNTLVLSHKDAGLTMFSVFSQCPKLVTLHFENNYFFLNLSENEEKELGEEAMIAGTHIQKPKMSCVNVETLLPTTIACNTRLKNLSLCLPSLTSTYMKYILQQIPVTLEKFKFVPSTAHRTILSDWLNVEDRVLYEFASHLSKTQELYIDMRDKVDPNEIESIQQLLSQWSYSLAKLWKVAKKLKGDEPFHRIEYTLVMKQICSHSSFSDRNSLQLVKKSQTTEQPGSGVFTLFNQQIFSLFDASNSASQEQPPRFFWPVIDNYAEAILYDLTAFRAEMEPGWGNMVPTQQSSFVASVLTEAFEYTMQHCRSLHNAFITCSFYKRQLVFGIRLGSAVEPVSATYELSEDGAAMDLYQWETIEDETRHGDQNSYKNSRKMEEQPTTSRTMLHNLSQASIGVPVWEQTLVSSVLTHLPLLKVLNILPTRFSASNDSEDCITLDVSLVQHLEQMKVHIIADASCNILLRFVMDDNNTKDDEVWYFSRCESNHFHLANKEDFYSHYLFKKSELNIYTVKCQKIDEFFVYKHNNGMAVESLLTPWSDYLNQKEGNEDMSSSI